MKKTILILLCLLGAERINAQNEYYGHDALRPLYTDRGAVNSQSIVLPGNLLVQTQINGSIDYKIADHLGSGRVMVDNKNTSLEACSYDAYGRAERNTLIACFLGTYTWNPQAQLYFSPSRKYDPMLKRFLSTDPLRQTTCPYGYAAGNPLLYLDRDGNMITVAYSDDPVTGWMRYTGEYSFHEIRGNAFLKNTFKALDYLYHNDATNIIYPSVFEDGRWANVAPGNVDILGTLVESEDHNILIRQSFDESYFLINSNEVFFDYRNGLRFKKELDGAYIESNVSYNSAASVLGHELLHAYRANLDRARFWRAKRKKYQADPMLFPNMEERVVTLDLANQINYNLKEDLRTHYRARLHPTADPRSIAPKIVTRLPLDDLPKTPVSGYLQQRLDLKQRRFDENPARPAIFER